MTIEPYLGRFIIRTSAKRVRYLRDKGSFPRWTTLVDRACTFTTRSEVQAAIDRMRGK